MSAIKLLALVAGAVSTVSAHGHVSGIVIAGKYYQGYDASFAYQDPPPKVIGWTADNLDNGFVTPSEYTDPNIICHKNGKPGQASATVAAGGKVELQWTVWPDSHHGPVLDYLAKCTGKCEDVDKTSLEFFKIDEGGLVSDTTTPGTWASDQLIAANNSWTVTIPSTIAPGNYVLRHEIIALHAAGQEDGAQNYPQCINLVVTGGGSDSPSGESAEKFYTPTDPGIEVDIYQALTSYKIPGPPVYGGGSGSGSSPSSAAPAPSSAASSAAPVSASSAAPVSSAAPSVPAGSATFSGTYLPGSSAAPVSSSPASSGSAPSSIAASSSKCTTRITISSSAAASSVAPVASSGPGGYPAPSSLTAPVSGVPAPTGSFPVPSGPAPTGGFPAPSGSSPSSGFPSVPVPSSTYVVPSVSASAPAGYPTGTAPPPPAGGVDMESLMSKIIAMVKSYFRQAEHGRDFKRRV